METSDRDFVRKMKKQLFTLGCFGGAKGPIPAFTGPTFADLSVYLFTGRNGATYARTTRQPAKTLHNAGTFRRKAPAPVTVNTAKFPEWRSGKIRWRWVKSKTTQHANR